MLFLLLIQYSMKLDPVTRRLPIESFSLTSTKSLGNCSPTRHEVVMIYIYPKLPFQAGAENLGILVCRIGVSVVDPFTHVVLILQ